MRLTTFSLNITMRAVALVAVVVMATGIPQGQGTSTFTPSLSCQLNTPAVVREYLGDDTFDLQKTIMKCNRSIEGATVSVNYVSDEAIQLELTGSSIDQTDYNFGFNIALAAHTGRNQILVEVADSGGLHSFAFEFLKDDAPPTIETTLAQHGVRITVVDSLTAITSITLYEHRASTPPEFLTRNILREQTLDVGPAQTPRQRSFLIESDTEGLVVAHDSGGNVAELYLGPRSHDVFMNELQNFFEKQRAQQVKAIEAESAGLNNKPKYGLQLAVVVMVPDQEPESVVIKRLQAAEEYVRESIQLLADIFTLNRRSVPGLLDETLKDLVLYMRKASSTSVVQIDRQALETRKLNQSGVLKRFPLIPTSAGETQPVDPPLYKYVIKDPHTFLKTMQDRILLHAFSVSSSGSQRMVLIGDEIASSSTPGALAVTPHSSGVGARTIVVPSFQRQGFSPDTVRKRRETLLHELGHTARLPHTDPNLADDRRSIFPIKHSIMGSHIGIVGDYFSYPQVLLFQRAFWGLPSSTARRPVAVNEVFLSKFDHDQNCANEHFLDRELEDPLMVFDRYDFPPESPTSLVVPPQYLMSSLSHDIRLESPFTPANIYGLFPHGTVKAFVPSGLLIPHSGRYPSDFQSDTLNAEVLSTDTFAVRSGVKVVHLGVIPLSRSIFEPICSVRGCFFPPRSNEEWIGGTEQGIAIAELPVPPANGSPHAYLKVFTLPPHLFVGVDDSALPSPMENLHVVQLNYPSAQKGIRRVVPLALVIRTDELIPIDGNQYVNEVNQ